MQAYCLWNFFGISVFLSIFAMQYCNGGLQIVGNKREDVVLFLWIRLTK